MRALSLLTVLCVSALAPAQSRATIQAKYDRFAAAYVRNDVRGMLSVLSRSYVITTESGTSKGYAEYRKQLEGRRKQNRPAKAYRVEIVDFKPQGGRLDVLTREVTVEGDGSQSPHYYRDTWRKEGKSWRLLATLGLPADFVPEKVGCPGD